MSRPSLNSNLTALARRAGELRFDDSPIARQQFDESRVEQFKNCYAVPQGFVVKQYLAGSQRTLGLFEQKFEYFATRFADLCIIHFWKYRKCSITRIVTDADLNYSVEIADSARRACPTVQSLLDQIERFLCQRFQINARPVTKTVQSLLPVYPIALTPADDLIIKKWAEHDQLWTTRETVEFNLRSFARAILGNHTVGKPPARATTATPKSEPDSVPVTTTGGDPGPVTISPLFSK